ncbi:MAG: hypothetical protein GY797_36295 [Deltaproteobacteria bacterium]|nr:hypothetical protein [Deltaproteobacteria bacterium]
MLKLISHNELLERLNYDESTGLCINGINKYLGTYNNFDNAVCARLAGEQCVNWSGCDSNSPAFKYVKGHIQTYA